MDSKFIQFLVETANQEFEASRSSHHSKGWSVGDDMEGCEEKSLLMHGDLGGSEGILPDPSAFRADVALLTVESLKWIEATRKAPPTQEEPLSEVTGQESSFLGDKMDAEERFSDLLADALAINSRFSAEPVFARTGTGFLRSVGVVTKDETKQ